MYVFVHILYGIDVFEMSIGTFDVNLSVVSIGLANVNTGKQENFELERKRNSIKRLRNRVHEISKGSFRWKTNNSVNKGSVVPKKKKKT